MQAAHAALGVTNYQGRWTLILDSVSYSDDVFIMWYLFSHAK